ncbi:MAG: SGNH/GDSL hydrolase family protein [Flavobacteriales bacterium]|nr:SGNH/GDSL hydrolase family protein [Flavobacteriales bacterium]
MRYVLYIIVLGFILSGCSDEEEEIVQPKSYVYLALGDSYTIGQSVSYTDRWPSQLVSKLDSMGITVDSLKFIAQTGWTTISLQNAINAEQPLGVFDMVSLLIGVNDQFQGAPFGQFQQGFDTLLTQAMIFAGGQENIFVVSIPDYGVTPFGSNNSDEIAEEIDMYNTYMQDECLDRGVPFINVTSISRNLGSSQGALASDNLHPSGYQYGLWANKIVPIAEIILD